MDGDLDPTAVAITFVLWTPLIVLLVLLGDGERHATGGVAFFGVYALITAARSQTSPVSAQVAFGLSAVAFSVVGAMVVPIALLIVLLITTAVFALLWWW